MPSMSSGGQSDTDGHGHKSDSQFVHADNAERARPPFRRQRPAARYGSSALPNCSHDPAAQPRASMLSWLIRVQGTPRPASWPDQGPEAPCMRHRRPVSALQNSARKRARTRSAPKRKRQHAPQMKTVKGRRPGQPECLAQRLADRHPVSSPMIQHDPERMSAASSPCRFVRNLSRQAQGFATRFPRQNADEAARRVSRRPR